MWKEIFLIEVINSIFMSPLERLEIGTFEGKGVKDIFEVCMAVSSEEAQNDNETRDLIKLKFISLQN